MVKVEVNQVIRSNRKTIALVVTKDATLIVRAPFHTPQSYIEDLVRKKSAWIKQKMNEVNQRPKQVKKEFVNGEGFLFLGKTYRLQIVEELPTEIELSDRLYLLKKAQSNAEEIIYSWYKSEAAKKIKERCEWFSKKTGYYPNSIKITDARKRWGSCSSKGNLNFNWRLILVPLEVLDYVIVHELIHMDQPNHSKFFWNKVRSIIPDFEKHRAWLKHHGSLLEI